MKKILIFCVIFLFGSAFVFAEDVPVCQRAVQPVKCVKAVKSSKKTTNNKKEKEKKLNSATGDDAQLENIDMQDNLKKQQETTETISNVSRTAHDTAERAIRNMK